MKIKFGAIIVAGSGKIGGHVASKNRSGAYMRTKVTPVNPNTQYQAAARNILSTHATNWGVLSSAARLAWNDAVDSFKRTDVFGDIKRPSGFNLYIKLNTMLQLIGVSALSLPPLPVSLPVITTGVLSAKVSESLLVTFTDDPVMSATEILVYATSAQNPGKSFVKSEFRLLGKSPAINSHLIQLYTLYCSRHGDVTPQDKQIFVKLQQVSKTTGQAGIPVILSCTIDPHS